MSNVVQLRTQTVRFCGVQPRKQHKMDAGFDLISDECDIIEVEAGGRRVFRTGTKVALPSNTVGLVCSRSGLARDCGLIVLNSPGVVDASYRGEIGVILHNTSEWAHYVAHGDRIAQLLIVPISPVEFQYDDDFAEDDTSRGPQGFGSTGNAA